MIYFSCPIYCSCSNQPVPVPIQLQALFNLATCSNYSITNYVKFPVFLFFKRVIKGELKMINTNYKTGQISLYCHFIEIVKGPGTSFQSSTLSQEHNRYVCYKIQYYLTKFHCHSTQDSKEISKHVTSIMQQCL